MKTTCRLSDGIGRKSNVAFADPICSQITGEAAIRHIGSTNSYGQEQYHEAEATGG